MRRNSSTVEMF